MDLNGMSNSSPSEFRFEKRRLEAVVTLSTGERARGSFFIAAGVVGREGPERIADVLNAESGLIPFETIDERGNRRSVLYNRAHLVTIALTENEAAHDPGYQLARRRRVQMRMSTGARIAGTLRISLPEGHDRLSDWTRLPETFRYVDEDERLLLVNAAHIIEVSEVSES